MNEEVRKLLKGKWKYNMVGDKLICRNRDEITFIFENKSNIVFGEILASLEKRGTPDINLNVKYDEPEITVSLDEFHRVLRSSELLYEPVTELWQNENGLFVSSEHTNEFELNHYSYEKERKVYVNPQQVCKITRKIRKRERVITAIALEDKRIILRCEFPWAIITIIIPTLRM